MMDSANKGFKDLYERLNDVYRQVREDYDIAAKSKRLEENENPGGCEYEYDYH
jgi:hypothetical protein